MGRDFQVNGETLVSVKGGEHMSGKPIGNLSELGMSVDQIRISPRFVHTGVKVDDFGPDIDADIMAMLADVTIHMQLIHYDREVLGICATESMGGSIFPGFRSQPDGRLIGAGKFLGAMKAPFASGNRFISVNLSSTELSDPWRFPTCYLQGEPVEIPLGNQCSVVRMTWKAIPYGSGAPIVGNVGGVILGSGVWQGGVPVYGEIVSSGRILWDHFHD